jgi:hypothetical protein
MKYPTARSLRKWGKKWWWVFPLWTALAVLSVLFTTFGFPSFGSAVASSNFANTGDWSMYLGGLGHSGYDNTETAITA